MFNIINRLKTRMQRRQDVSKNLSQLPSARPNLLLLTYDSCRYDTMVMANTPVLDAYSRVCRAYSPATYTYPAHQSFFCGILPGVLEAEPYYNRFIKQFLAFQDVGDGIIDREKGDATFLIKSSAANIVAGLSDLGYYTVGSGGANWFAKDSLRIGFDEFFYKSHAPAREQISIVTEAIKKKASTKNFFAFINFMETHTPYMHYSDSDYHMTARKKMSWPPVPDPSEAEYGKKLHQAQIAAAEYLDTCLPLIFDEIPKNTIVILLGDHGEAFGEDGYWGHGVCHEKVLEVPMAIFYLAGHRIP